MVVDSTITSVVLKSRQSKAEIYIGKSMAATSSHRKKQWPESGPYTGNNKDAAHFCSPTKCLQQSWCSVINKELQVKNHL